MNAHTLTLLAVLAAPAALAQYPYHHASPVAEPLPAVVQDPGCGARPEPRGVSGRWELRTTQQFVAGTTQQVWVAGQCFGNSRKPWKQRCEPGRYVTTTTPGHYETRQQWVWVDYQQHERFEHRYGRRHSRVDFGVRIR
ncbi:MAG: hypothetical protein JNJ54_36295 [Myxococcaceae bacterium]|nr:hypothetical protein [Myxococcaceae bacterium]